MKKKQIKHFVPRRNSYGNGEPACNCYSGSLAYSDWGEVAKTKRGVTCGRCRGTRAFRKLK